MLNVRRVNRGKEINRAASPANRNSRPRPHHVIVTWLDPSPCRSYVPRLQSVLTECYGEMNESVLCIPLIRVRANKIMYGYMKKYKIRRTLHVVRELDSFGPNRRLPLSESKVFLQKDQYCFKPRRNTSNQPWRM